MKPPVRIPNPCPKRWGELNGDAGVRFCEHCQQHVHNLSEMNQRERTALLSNSQNKVCVAFETDAKGRFISRKDSSLLIGQIRRLKVALISTIAAVLPVAFSSCVTRQTLGRPCPPADYKEMKTEESGDKEFITVGEFIVERPLWKRILWPF